MIITGLLRHSIAMIEASEAQDSTVIDHADQALGTDIDEPLPHLDDKHPPMVNF